MVTPPSKNNILLDPFAGSGTTLVAAKELGIPYVGIEIIPEYIEIIKKRLGESVNKETLSKKENTIVQPHNLKLFPEEMTVGQNLFAQK